ncbi:21 kDa subunit of NADH dehydrogenase [Xylariaceae sp. FL0662B]|nr:21 kDa subunit of NADH dehydrogenase [Xylariaceae sp. FL0662B]
MHRKQDLCNAITLADHKPLHPFPCLTINERHQKQTLESTGIWDRIRRLFAVDPDRSSGVPLIPYYRNPPPGALDPLTYDDPVTIPAGDIADNPYWKRDARRGYPTLSFVSQGDAVGLLSVGSAAAPKRELVGEAGAKQLVAAREEGQTGLAAYFRKNTDAAKDVLVDGLPPLPSGQSLRDDGKWEVYKYSLAEENSYPDEYPCRSFK